MPNNKPGDSLETSNHARSLGIALGVTELLFIAGITLLATGIWLEFGAGYALAVSGGLMVYTAFYNAKFGG